MMATHDTKVEIPSGVLIVRKGSKGRSCPAPRYFTGYFCGLMSWTDDIDLAKRYPLGYLVLLLDLVRDRKGHSVLLLQGEKMTSLSERFVHR